MKKLKNKFSTAISRKNVRGGELCFKGTRIPVSFVLEFIAKGWSVDELPELFPTLDKRLVRSFINEVSENLERTNHA